MNKKIYISVAFATGLLLIGACSDDSVQYQAGANIMIDTPHSVDCGATFISLSTVFHKKDDARYTKAGYVLSENPGPTIYDSVYEGLIENDQISVTILDLAPSREYYVRAFMNEYNGPVVYSESLVFTTAEGTLDEQLANYRGPEYPDYYVDLSSWADCGKWNLANVHDPSVVKAADGYFYMYQTDASYGNAHEEGGHFHGRRSKDLINWEYLGGTMHEVPEWVVPKYNEILEGMGLPESYADQYHFGYWAPSVIKVNDNLYRMYYSLVPDRKFDGDDSWTVPSMIGLMENSNPADNDAWEDKGFVICSSSDKGLDFNIPTSDFSNAYSKFNAIDPSAIITENGEHWLIYGSWHSGIAAVKLDPATGKTAETLGKPWGTSEEISSYGKLIATREMGSRWQASEGPEVIYHNGYYYLFLAYDGLDIPYNTRVVRSKNIEGPYLDINGTDVTNNGGNAFPVVTHPYKFKNSDGWVGFSHCTVFDDGAGNWYYASQARFPAGVMGNEFSNALMMGHIRSIVWTEDGWPLVLPERYGAVPQLPINEEEIIGAWENIELAYNYGQQDSSESIILSSDHTVKGGKWDGSSWSYDSTGETVDINGVKLYLKRECDWEAAERPATIVFAGYDGTVTWWGKKSR